MFYRFLITLILLTIAWTTSCEADSTNLVSLDLSLAGYQLGMTYEEVAEVRPFSYEQSDIKSPENIPTFYASVERVYIDGAIMSLKANFKNEKVHKIVARVSPDFFENALQNIQNTIGTGEDRSRDFRNYNDEVFHQTIYHWDFPNAEIYMVKISSNTEYATIGLMSK